MTDPTPRLRTAADDDNERTRCRPESRRTTRARGHRRFVRLALTSVGLVVCSAPASAHGLAHGVGHDGPAAVFAVVFGLPVLTGLAGGLAAVRYRDRRRVETVDRTSTDRSIDDRTSTGRTSSVGIGLLLVGLGAASLLAAVTGHFPLSVGGGTIGAAIAGWFASRKARSVTGCGNHADVTLGAICTHRLLEGIVVGALYSAGTAAGVLGAVVLAGHTALETAAIGGLYAPAPRRSVAVAAVALVQVSYVVGVVGGLGVTGRIPAPVQVLVLAAVGGALLVVGATETKHSIATARTAESPS